MGSPFSPQIWQDLQGIVILWEGKFHVPLALAQSMSCDLTQWYHVYVANNKGNNTTFEVPILQVF